MNRFVFVILISCFNLIAFGQSTQTESVFFDLNSFDIKNDEMQKLVKFAKAIDTRREISITINGYCDDRGKEDYNYILSQNRADKIKDILMKHSIQRKIFVKIEGKGRVLLADETAANVEEIRTKNRRVDVEVKIGRAPKLFNWLQKDHVVNDRVYLLNIFFERGSDALDAKSTAELNHLIIELKKYKKLCFEVHGHVCCTPPNQNDAVNRATNQRTLSVDRAKKVHDYLLKKGIAQNRMSYKGFGKTKPLDGAKDHFNRRVELFITRVD